MVYVLSMICCAEGKVGYYLRGKISYEAKRKNISR